MKNWDPNQSRLALAVACLAALAGLLAAPVHAEVIAADGPLDDSPQPPPPPAVANTLSLNLAPALCGVAALHYDRALAGWLSVGVLGAFGIGNSLSEFQDLAYYQLGAQAKVFPIGGFRHGAGLSLEVAASLLGGPTARDRGGISLSPRIFYRRVTDWGMTLEAQIGAAFVERRAAALVPGGWAYRSDVGPIHAINVGYSF